MSLCITFLTHIQITIRLGFPKRKLLLLNILAWQKPFRYCPVHGWFPQRQCCKYTIWVNTDQWCPYGNSTPRHESISAKLSSLIVGVFEKIPVEYIFPHFLPFNSLSKSLISSDLQWLAKLVLQTLPTYIGELPCNKYLFERCICSLINAFVLSVEFLECLWMAHNQVRDTAV